MIETVSHLPYNRTPSSYYTIRQLATWLDVSYQMIWKRIKAGDIHAVRINSHKRSTMRIPESEVLKLLTPYNSDSRL
jgi:excisionase family DNA binding protein